jgi:hypothetical protein
MNVLDIIISAKGIHMDKKWGENKWQNRRLIIKRI